MNALRHTTVLIASLSALLAGCSDDPTTPTDAATDVAADAAPGDASAQDASARDAGAGLRFLAQFSAATGQLPEGIAIRDGSVYVGYAPTGQVVRVDATGAVTPFGQVPIPPSASPTAPNGYLLGLAFDRAGNLYAAAPSFGAAFQPGVYRMPSTGGAATLFARDAMGRMTFPNGIDFDASGAMFVTDSHSGSVFRVSADGATVTQWVTDALLTGVAGANPCGPGAGFPIGANGLVVDSTGGNVYVTNTDRATLLRIPITASGAAGAPVVLVAQNCASLAGADGLTRGPDGALYVAANASNTLARVSLDGAQVTALEQGGALESPATIAFGALSGASTMFITNAAFGTAQTPGATPHPGLLVRPAM